MRSSITGRRLFAKGAVVIVVGMLMKFPTSRGAVNKDDFPW